MKQNNYLGIDIGGTAVKIGVVDSEGVVKASESFDVAFDNYETPILETVVGSIPIFLEKYGFDISEMIAIAVSATGAIDTNNGVVAGTAGHIKNWQGSEIKKRLEQEFNKECYVLNDANAAALGEAWIGSACGQKNAVVITVGTGIGGGIIIDGKILLGKDGFGGEIGHIPIQCEGEECSCKNVGCLEHYGSTSNLVRMVEKAVMNGLLPELKNQKIDGKLIFELAHEGNATIISIINKWIYYISSGLVGLIHIFNPQVIIVGGGVSAQEKLFIEPLKEAVLSKVMPHFGRNLQIKSAALGNNAGLVGAVYYCKQQKAL